MSYTKNQLEIVENAHADFDEALAQGKWADARAMIDSMGEQGFEMEALYMHKSYNRAWSEAGVVYVPYEHPTHHTITPAEDDAPVSVTSHPCPDYCADHSHD